LFNLKVIHSRYCAHSLFFCGAAFSLLAAAKIPQDSSSLSLFALGFLLSALGVWRLRSAGGSTLSAMGTVAASKTSPFAHLDLDLQALAPLVQAAHLHKKPLAASLEQLHSNTVLVALAQQEQLDQQLGRAACAEIYLALAQGERLLNRMRSALSDDCTAEVQNVFPHMQAALRLTQSRWQAQENALNATNQ